MNMKKLILKKEELEKRKGILSFILSKSDGEVRITSIGDNSKNVCLDGNNPDLQDLLKKEIDSIESKLPIINDRLTIIEELASDTMAKLYPS